MRFHKSLTFLILTLGLVFTLPAWAQQKPMTQAQVQALVRDGFGDESGAKLIEQRGIDFALAEDFVQALRAAGATEVFLNALRTAKPPSAALPQASKAGGLLSPVEIQIYQSAQTVMDWTPRQIHDCPFVHKLRPASSQKQLPMILERVGQTGDLLLSDFPQISSLEAVHTGVDSPQVAPDEQFTGDLDHMQVHNQMRQAMQPSFPPQDRKFRYIVIPRTKGGLPGFEEYRTDINGSPLGISSLDRVFMITSDFVSTGLYLTSAHQPDSSFRYFGMEAIRKRECHVVAFAQVPERVHTIGLFIVRGKTAALLTQGLAWIDSETFQLLRVTIWLLAPRGDVGLKSVISTVDFFPDQPSGTERTLWLPRDVTVVGTYQGVTFHNKHHYSDFKLFRVESTIKPGP
jgi:hypothetical protein